LDETLGWQANFWMLAILGLLVLALVWRDLGETAARGAASFAEQFANTRSFSPPAASGAIASPRPSPRAPSSPIWAARPYVGSEVFGLGRRGRALFRRAGAGVFLRQLAFRALLRAGGDQRHDPVGDDPVGGGLLVSLLLFLLGFKTALVFFGFMTFVGLGNGMVLPNATSGMLSVRPHLAGTASGLGGALMLGGGAALSALAGALLTRGEGAYPLLLIMLATSVLAVASILYTIRRERQVTGA
jgi:DHA1 family bicyclomycin/chloramphenicol resistance-like MFS transporter